MKTLAEIKTAAKALSLPQQKNLLRHLAARLRKPQRTKRGLPLVPATGHPITQEEIDNASDTDASADLKDYLALTKARVRDEGKPRLTHAEVKKRYGVK